MRPRDTRPAMRLEPSRSKESFEFSARMPIKSIRLKQNYKRTQTSIRIKVAIKRRTRPISQMMKVKMKKRKTKNLS